MVALPSGLILCLVAGFVCWYRERERLRRLGEDSLAGQHRSEANAGQQTGRRAESHCPPSGGAGRRALMSGPGSHQHQQLAEEAPGLALTDSGLVSAPGGPSTDGGYDLHRTAGSPAAPMARAADQANYYFDNHRRNVRNAR